MVDNVKLSRHKIGGARTIQTAILVTEFLKKSCAHPHSKIPADCIHYHFKDPSPENGFWSADIIVDVYGDYDPEKNKATDYMVSICRAFVAGAGEIWS